LYTTEYNKTARSGKRHAKLSWTARPRWRLSCGTEIALGPGKADLLDAIRRAGTISGAARELGMSYRRAWLLVKEMNRCFTKPLVSTSSWRGKGAALTQDGERVLELYRRIESDSLRAVRRPLAGLQNLLREDRLRPIKRGGSTGERGRMK
jgi:molybdate transport system regulatory protein